MVSSDGFQSGWVLFPFNTMQVSRTPGAENCQQSLKTGAINLFVLRASQELCICNDRF